jgi:hypothetical protein
VTVLAVLGVPGAARAAPSDDELLPVELELPAPGLQAFWSRYGCRWESPTRSDVALLAFAEALIVIDAAQTIHGCRDSFAVQCEVGLGSLVMGTRPTTEAIIGVSAAAAVGTAALWYVLPRPWRKGFIIAVDVGEGLNVAANFTF